MGVTEGQVTGELVAKRRLWPAAAVASTTAPALYGQGSINLLSRSGIHIEAIFDWKTVRERDMNPRSMSSEHTMDTHSN